MFMLNHKLKNSLGRSTIISILFLCNIINFPSNALRGVSAKNRMIGKGNRVAVSVLSLFINLDIYVAFNHDGV